ncbi:MAG: HAD-IB family phosphatase [Candidatus Hadarchaeum sp.]|uniref:HAD-IB family phosphatase n=1 Tax=Candidatus Hadarchaeum sp. TaxID=2883567 RepID=UPI003D11D44C
MRYKLVAFDMDGTLILEESCWGMIHQRFGTRTDALRNLMAYESGQIDYKEFMRRDIALWRPVPTIEDIKKILSNYTLAPNVKMVVEEIIRRGFQTAIITGGLDVLASNVARELGIPHVIANGLEVDESGYLAGEGILRVEPRQKDRNLVRLAEDLGVSLEECVAVGDGKYDVNFLKKAGLAVAVGNNPELVRVADVVIESFDHFPRLLDYLG